MQRHIIDHRQVKKIIQMISLNLISVSLQVPQRRSWIVLERTTMNLYSRHFKDSVESNDPVSTNQDQSVS